ncbi:MAG: hypothetical protein ACFFD6_02990 [Candidatus Thorarchaeota archaeon]
MVVRLVAKVNTPDMSTLVLYPVDERRDERLALLTGIIQLVTAALSRDGSGKAPERELFYMKSSTGVVGYFVDGDCIYICEGDGEGETGDALKGVLSEINSSESDISSKIEDITEKPGKEIGDLWK